MTEKNNWKNLKIRKTLTLFASWFKAQVHSPEPLQPSPTHLQTEQEVGLYSDRIEETSTGCKRIRGNNKVHRTQEEHCFYCCYVLFHHSILHTKLKGKYTRNPCQAFITNSFICWAISWTPNKFLLSSFFISMKLSVWNIKGFQNSIYKVINLLDCENT